MSLGVISLQSLVPERLDFASRDSATNGGLYISCSGAVRHWATGSCNFAFATELMANIGNWDRSTKHNVDVAHRAFAMLICAHVFVLKCLLEKLPSDTDAETTRR